MKKIMNQADNVVSDMLTGIVAVNPNVAYDSEGEVIYRKNKTEKVGLVSGGGSGHEPAHAGYVGKGMLDAAVAGNVFASPDPARILNGIEHAALRLQCSRRQLQRVIKSLCEQGKLVRLGKGRYKMTEKG